MKNRKDIISRSDRLLGSVYKNGVNKNLLNEALWEDMQKFVYVSV